MAMYNKSLLIECDNLPRSKRS